MSEGACFKPGGLKLTQEVSIKGLVIAGTRSGSGKTTVTLGLLASLVRRGISVAPFKVGPDYIDPGHHKKITGCASRNLDGWMIPRERNLRCFKRHAHGAGVAVVEGVMGLFDGFSGKSEDGSTAQMAKWLNLPVLLIVDAKSMARSAAAVVQGFERFDIDLTFAGVIFNHVASSRHLAYLKDAVQDTVKMPCLGGITSNAHIAIPERHLGLVTSEDHPLNRENMNRLADIIEDSMDIDSLLHMLPEVDMDSGVSISSSRKAPKRIKIGVAMDRAFCFYYQDNLDLLEARGAEIVYFSPIKDTVLPDDLDGLYFGGGYPELYAETLSANHRIREQIRNKQQNGIPIYAECGGFMYLCSELTDTQGHRYPMVGCFPFTTRMFTKLKVLGYREITLTKDTILGNRNQTIRGHEFHYSELNEYDSTTETVYQVSARVGVTATQEGFQTGRCLGSYIHLHFGSCPEAAAYFVNICEQYQKERLKHRERRRN